LNQAILGSCLKPPTGKIFIIETSKEELKMADEENRWNDIKDRAQDMFGERVGGDEADEEKDNSMESADDHDSSEDELDEDSSSQFQQDFSDESMADPNRPRFGERLGDDDVDSDANYDTEKM
jgi:hypothetical protein